MSDESSIPTPTDERATRRARRQALIDAGINPYPVRSEVTTHVADIEEKHADLADGESTDDVVSVAGRIRAIRNQGKAAFVVLEDVTGSLQLFCRVNNLSDQDWALLGQLDVANPLLRIERAQEHDVTVFAPGAEVGAQCSDGHAADHPVRGDVGVVSPLLVEYVERALEKARRGRGPRR